MTDTTRRRLLLAMFLLSGVSALVYEVVWTRALSLVLGSTTYALSTMLATFMSGLAIGGWVGGRLADRRPDRLRLFGGCELGIGLTGLVSVPLIYAMPQLYLAIYRQHHGSPLAFFVLQIVLCAGIMLLPTILMGATFPIVSRAITPGLQEMGRRVGSAYSLNTLGAVLGSLLAGFLLVPLLGVRGATVVAAALNLVVGGVALVASGFERKALGAGVVAAYAVAALWGGAADFAGRQLTFYNAHRYLDGAPYEELVEQQGHSLQRLSTKWYPEGAVTAYRDVGGHLILQVGGKIEGTGPQDVHNTLLLAYLPLASHPSPRSMLVIGLGAGVTLAAAKPHVTDISLAEIHPGVLEVVARFGPPGLLSEVEILQQDARQHLLRTEARYDVISSEPSYPTEAGVANLFTREYFQLASQRLTDDGVYCQWLPYHMLTNWDVTMMVKTFGLAFPYVHVWKVPDGLDLLLIGSHSPLPFAPEEIERRVATMSSSAEPLRFTSSRTAQQVAEIVARPEVPINTDDHPRLEFRAVDNLLRADLAAQEREEIERGLIR